MAGLFGYLAAGAAQGVGGSIQEQAKAKREAAVRELEQMREMSWRTSEREASQEFTAGENEKTRLAGADVVTLESGESGVRIGDTVQPLKGPDGQTARLVGDSKSDPAKVAEAEWLIRNGVAKTREDAWNMVQAGKTPPVTLKDIDEMALKAADMEMEGAVDRDPETVRAVVDRHRQDLMERHGVKPASDKSAPSTRAEGEGMPRPAGASEEEIVAEAKKAVRDGRDPAGVRSQLRRWGIDPKDAGL